MFAGYVTVSGADRDEVNGDYRPIESNGEVPTFQKDSPTIRLYYSKSKKRWIISRLRTARGVTVTTIKFYSQPKEEASKTIPNAPSEWHTHTVSSNWFMHMGRKVTGTKKKHTRCTLTFSVVPNSRPCSSDTNVISSPKGRPAVTLEADTGDFTDNNSIRSNDSVAEMQSDPLDVSELQDEPLEVHELMEDGSQMALTKSDTIIISSEPTQPSETMSHSEFECNVLQPSFSMLEEVVRPSVDLESEDLNSSE